MVVMDLVHMFSRGGGDSSGRRAHRPRVGERSRGSVAVEDDHRGQGKAFLRAFRMRIAQ